MFKDAFIRNGRVFVQAGFEGDYNGSFGGADTFSPVGMVTLPYEEFEEKAPSTHLPDSFSARGLVTDMRMRRRLALDIHQKVLNDLSQNHSLRDANRPFEWDLLQLPEAPEEIVVQAKKLSDYLLDPGHKDNRGKAKFFEEQLAITSKDWAYLQGQFIDGLGNVSYEDVRLDSYLFTRESVYAVSGDLGKPHCLHFAIQPMRKEGADDMVANGELIDPWAHGNYLSSAIGHGDAPLTQRHSPADYTKIVVIQ